MKGKKKKTRKETKEKKTYYSYHYSLGYYLKLKSVPPASAIIYRPDFPWFSQCTPPHLYSIAWVYLSR